MLTKESKTSEAEIEDIADDKVLVCPWHQFDFSLKTGLSTTSGLQACTFKVVVKDDSVFVEPPGNPGDDWRLISIRPVSESMFGSSTKQLQRLIEYFLQNSPKGQLPPKIQFETSLHLSLQIYTPFAA